MKCLVERSSNYEKLTEGQAGYLFLGFYKNNLEMPTTKLWHCWSAFIKLWPSD